MCEYIAGPTSSSPSSSNTSKMRLKEFLFIFVATISSFSVTNSKQVMPPPCLDNEFTCDMSPHWCAPAHWVCDGDVDCPDKSDETNCEKEEDKSSSSHRRPTNSSSGPPKLIFPSGGVYQASVKTFKSKPTALSSPYVATPVGGPYHAMPPRASIYRSQKTPVYQAQKTAPVYRRTNISAAQQAFNTAARNYQSRMKNTPTQANPPAFRAQYKPYGNPFPTSISSSNRVIIPAIASPPPSNPYGNPFGSSRSAAPYGNPFPTNMRKSFSHELVESSAFSAKIPPRFSAESVASLPSDLAKSFHPYAPGNEYDYSRQVLNDDEIVSEEVADNLKYRTTTTGRPTTTTTIATTTTTTTPQPTTTITTTLAADTTTGSQRLAWTTSPYLIPVDEDKKGPGTKYWKYDKSVGWVIVTWEEMNPESVTTTTTTTTTLSPPTTSTKTTTTSRPRTTSSTSKPAATTTTIAQYTEQSTTPTTISSTQAPTTVYYEYEVSDAPELTEDSDRRTGDWEFIREPTFELPPQESIDDSDVADNLVHRNEDISIRDANHSKQNAIEKSSESEELTIGEGFSGIYDSTKEISESNLTREVPIALTIGSGRVQISNNNDEQYDSSVVNSLKIEDHSQTSSVTIIASNTCEGPPQCQSARGNALENLAQCLDHQQRKVVPKSHCDALLSFCTAYESYRSCRIFHNVTATPENCDDNQQNYFGAIDAMFQSACNPEVFPLIDGQLQCLASRRSKALARTSGWCSADIDAIDLDTTDGCSLLDKFQEFLECLSKIDDSSTDCDGSSSRKALWRIRAKLTAHRRKLDCSVKNPVITHRAVASMWGDDIFKLQPAFPKCSIGKFSQCGVFYPKKDRLAVLDEWLVGNYSNYYPTCVRFKVFESCVQRRPKKSYEKKLPNLCTVGTASRRLTRFILGSFCEDGSNWMHLRKLYSANNNSGEWPDKCFNGLSDLIDKARRYNAPAKDSCGVPYLLRDGFRCVLDNVQTEASRGWVYGMKLHDIQSSVNNLLKTITRIALEEGCPIARR